ncbi:hypothetical protein HMPREF9957_1736 [Streptococcus mitis SK1080]|uniref:Uncharacterized protein n=1 Tax=Streptococcus mitis SK1080 TaxID=1008453 RepID=F9HNS1_STRMT|nr:hypothetical protein HMPREF9957_1736 [Streptococcus mitis SK1080]
MLFFIWLLILVPVYFYEKSLQALSKYGRMEAVELEKEIGYEIS